MHLPVASLRRCDAHRRGAMWLSGARKARSETRGAQGYKRRAWTALVRRCSSQIPILTSGRLIDLQYKTLTSVFSDNGRRSPRFFYGNCEELRLTVAGLRRCGLHRQAAMWLSGARKARSETRGARGFTRRARTELLGARTNRS